MKIKYLEIYDLPQEFLVEKTSIKVKFLKNSTGEINTWAYLVSISEIVNGFQQIGAGTLLIANNYILVIILGNGSVYIYIRFSW